jgi:hypothetical protein
MAEKTLTLESLETILGAKFAVTDLILDSRCAPCSGFSKEEKAAGCAGCSKKSSDPQEKKAAGCGGCNKS